MFYGSYITSEGKVIGGFYTDYEEWYRETFCPDTKIITVIDLTVHGKSYSERQSNVQEKAHAFQDLFAVHGLSLYGHELFIFEDYFSIQGKRFGLLREFRENGIC